MLALFDLWPGRERAVAERQRKDGKRGVRSLGLARPQEKKFWRGKPVKN
jgi:hypothetical protein